MPFPSIAVVCHDSSDSRTPFQGSAARDLAARLWPPGHGFEIVDVAAAGIVDRAAVVANWIASLSQ
jgi:hypothetical protein